MSDNVSGGIGAALVILAIIGGVVGLPAILWIIWASAIGGWLVATNEKQKAAVRNREAFANRPWTTRGIKADD